jgi:hypothetical protein
MTLLEYHGVTLKSEEQIRHAWILVQAFVTPSFQMKISVKIHFDVNRNVDRARAYRKRK